MNGMLDIGMLAALKPISSFSPARLRELLDYCHLELAVQGQDPFKSHGLHGQSVYLLQGQLELEYADGNRVVVRADSEWAKHPLGKRQPEISSATALSNIQLLRIDDEMLDMMVTWDQFSPLPQGGRRALPGDFAVAFAQQDAGKLVAEGETAHDVAASMKRLLSSGMFSAENLKNGPFAHLPPANIGQLISCIEVVAAWANDVIIREGDEGDYYYMIKSGRAQITRLVRGVDMLLAELKAGDVFGEEALISGAKRNASVTMKTNGMLMRIKQQDFLELMQEPLLRRVHYEDALKKITRGATWLDVRHPSEYRYDKLSGAMNVPLNDIRNAAGTLKMGHTYIVYCQSGRRSSAAAFILVQAGHDVYVLEGGLWVVPKSPQQWQ